MINSAALRAVGDQLINSYGSMPPLTVVIAALMDPAVIVLILIFILFSVITFSLVR